MKRVAVLVATLAVVLAAKDAVSRGPTTPAAARVFPLPRADGWRAAGQDGVRGITIGPIENAYHAGVGYGSAAYGRTLDECARMGATWIALTTFGRVYDLTGRGVDPTFEVPVEKNRDAIRRAIRAAHARGLKVMLVPHLWVESNEWRAKIDPGTDDGWAAWTRSYAQYATDWARVAESEHVELFSAGVELRSWVTTARAPAFAALVRALRAIYTGPITYSGNWDDIEDTLILPEIDVIGINAFYPLAAQDGAPFATLLEGGRRVRERVAKLADTWQKPVLFTEIGYTTRRDPAIRPWEWPDDMTHPKVDEEAQADAYRALLAPLLDEPRFMGFFVWRVYADPDDVSQEAEWGFSPRGKRAELVVRDAFATWWAGDASRLHAWAPGAKVPGIYP
jgi:hypothetical protein